MAVQNTIYVLDSTQRNAGGSIQVAVYNMIPAGGLEAGTYEMLSYQSQNVSYNVETGVNDAIYFDEGAAELGPVLLAPGYYDTTTLGAEIKLRMDAVSGSAYTVTYSAVTGKFTVAIGAGTFAFNWATVAANKANQLLGFGLVDGVIAATQVSTIVADLTLHKSLIVDINEDSQQNVTLLDGSEHSVLIPLNQAYTAEIDSLRNETYAQTFKFGSTLNQLTVSLFTDNGAVPVNVAEYVMVIRKIF